MSQRELFRVENLPVFQNKVFDTKEAAKAALTANMVLVQDLETALIYNAAFDPDLLVYDRDYQNEQALSIAFQHHLSDVQAVIGRHFKTQSLIEVGCGKGYFLEYLKGKGFMIKGLDPAYEGDNPDVIAALFEPELGMQADAILLRHVLEHMHDPIQFLRNIAKANGEKGYVYIEVPCFDWICEHNAWFDIFYEHVNYFRVSDFQRMFSDILEVGHLFGGQYIYVVADLASLRQPVKKADDIFLFPDDFSLDLASYAQIIVQSQGVNAVWGGSSKGVIFSLAMQRQQATVDLVVDINPAKQGKFLAVTGVQVVSPSVALQQLDKDANIFVMNSNYMHEIIEMSGNKFKYIQVEKT